MNSYSLLRLLQSVMMPSIPNPKYLMSASRRTNSLQDGSRTKMEATQAFSEKEEILGFFADYLVYEKHQAEERRPVHAENTATRSQTTLRDAAARIHDLINDSMTALVSLEDHNGITRTKIDHIQCCNAPSTRQLTKIGIPLNLKAASSEKLKS